MTDITKAYVSVIHSPFMSNMKLELFELAVG